MEKHHHGNPTITETRAMEEDRVFECVIVTPETTVRDGPAQFVALPLFDGEIGIAPLHSPMIGRLGYGEMRVVEGEKTERYYVDGGFVQVADNVVSVITNRCLPAGQVSAAAAEEQLAAAMHRPANTPELLAIRERMIKQARAQRRVAQRASGTPSTASHH